MSDERQEPDVRSLYERVGARPFFEALVARFYLGIAEDALLRPMYPDELGPAEDRLLMFLVQFCGGPAEYEAARGEPRLRARHMLFDIDERARDAWLERMAGALAEMEIPEKERNELWSSLFHTATFLINRGGLTLT